MQYLIGFFLIILVIILIIALFISLLELLFITLSAWALGLALMLLVLILMLGEKRSRLDSPKTLSRFVDINFDGRDLNFKIIDSQLAKFSRPTFAILLSLTVGILASILMLNNLAEKGSFKGLYYFGYKVSEDISEVTGYILSFVIIILVICWANPQKTFLNSLKKRINKLLGKIKSQISKIEELESLEKSMNTILASLNIRSHLNFRSEIQDYIETNKSEFLSHTNAINNLIERSIKQAREDKSKLDKAHRLYEDTMNQYKNTAQKVKVVGSIFLIKEMEFDYEGLVSENLKSLLLEKKWKDFQGVLSSIKEDLLRLNKLAIKIQEEGYEEEDDFKEETEEAKAYRILGVPHTATNDQIKKAYKTFASIWHPDAKTAEDDIRIKEINWAYEHLKHMRKFT